jgi:hypothetical protein
MTRPLVLAVTVAVLGCSERRRVMPERALEAPEPACAHQPAPAVELADGAGVIWIRTRVGLLYLIRKIASDFDLQRIPIAGGEPETIASGIDVDFTFGLNPVALDDAHVYWSDPRGIVRRRHSGGAAEVVVHGVRPRLIAVNRHALYYRDRDGVTRAPHDGGATMLLPEADRDFAVEADAVYWEARRGPGDDDDVVFGMTEGGRPRELCAGIPHEAEVFIHDAEWSATNSAGGGEVLCEYLGDEPHWGVFAVELSTGKRRRTTWWERFGKVRVTPAGEALWITPLRRSAGRHHVLRTPMREDRWTTVAVTEGGTPDATLAIDFEYVFEVVGPRITRRRRCDRLGPAM